MPVDKKTVNAIAVDLSAILTMLFDKVKDSEQLSLILARLLEASSGLQGIPSEELKNTAMRIAAKVLQLQAEEQLG